MQSESERLLDLAAEEIPRDHCANTALQLAAQWKLVNSRWLRERDKLRQLEYASRMDAIAACASACGVQKQFHALITQCNGG